MKLNMRRNSPIFVLASIVIIGLLFSFVNILADSGGAITATVQIRGCGNNIIEDTEECDGSDLNEETCVTKGYVSGDLSCNADCTFNVSSCSSKAPYTSPPSGGGGGGVRAPALTTQVIIQGVAHPYAEITILKDGQYLVDIIADSKANFKTILAITSAGIYTFGVWSEDVDGRRSITFSFTVTVTAGMITTISGIFIPPTIELEKTTLTRGESLNILGQTVPESEITVNIGSLENIIKQTAADEAGDWNYSFDTGPLANGLHTVRAKAVSPVALSSTYSSTLVFVIGEGLALQPKTGNINQDNRINLIDFSILLYNWGIPKNPAADLNNDNKVNLTDFSIMLYYWTG